MPDLNRRDAIRLAFGMGDWIAMEREQQSAIDIVRGAPERSADVAPVAPPEPAPRSLFARLFARLPFIGKRSVPPGA